MSGSSLDGLDMALCSFSGLDSSDKLTFELLKTESSNFPQPILQKLKTVKELSAKELIKFDAEFGSFLGKKSLEFLEKYNPP